MIRGRIPVPHFPYRLREAISIFICHSRKEMIHKPAWELLLLATHDDSTAALPSLLARQLQKGSAFLSTEEQAPPFLTPCSGGEKDRGQTKRKRQRLAF